MKFSGKVGTNDYTLVVIQIIVWTQGLFSGFVTIGRYRKWLTVINLLLNPVIHSYWFTRWWQ